MKLTLDIINRDAFRLYGYKVAYTIHDNGIRYDIGHYFHDEIILELNRKLQVAYLEIRHADIPAPFIEYLKTKVVPDLLPELLQSTAKHSATLDYATEVQRYLEAQRLEYLHDHTKSLRNSNIAVDIESLPILPELGYDIDFNLRQNSMSLDFSKDGTDIYSLWTYPADREWEVREQTDTASKEDLDSILSYLNSSRDAFFGTLSKLIQEANLNKMAEEILHGV